MFLNLVLTTLLTLSAVPTSSGRTTQDRRILRSRSFDVDLDDNATTSNWTSTNPAVAHDIDAVPLLAKRNKRRNCGGDCPRKTKTKTKNHSGHSAKSNSKHVKSGESSSSSGHRLIQVQDPKCGPSRATCE